MAQMTNVMENALVDAVLRGQTPAFPTTWTLRLYTAAPTETGGGTEASYTGYAPVTIAASLANFAGTQGAGTTTASTGSGGVSSNNGTLTFGTASTGATQTLTHWALCNGTTPWIFGALETARVISNGDQAPVAQPGDFTFTFA